MSSFLSRPTEKRGVGFDINKVSPAFTATNTCLSQENELSKMWGFFSTLSNPFPLDESHSIARNGHWKEEEEEEAVKSHRKRKEEEETAALCSGRGGKGERKKSPTAGLGSGGD